MTIPVCEREYRYGHSDHRFYIEPRVQDTAAFILAREGRPLTITPDYEGRHRECE